MAQRSWRPGKRLLIGLPPVLFVGGIVGLFVAEGPGGGHAAANRAQLKRGCGGLLPYGDLRSLVPDEVEGEVSQYGTCWSPARRAVRS